MINIEKGRYWDEGITLVDGCTPCSPGCRGCWSAGISYRFGAELTYYSHANDSKPGKETGWPTFNGNILTHPERLKRFNARKPKVFAIWNDLFHEAVPWEFVYGVYSYASNFPKNTILALTKRPGNMVKVLKDVFFHLHRNGVYEYDHIWHGLTVCNQQEVDDKIPLFLQVPGKKFLSIEPMLGQIDVFRWIQFGLLDKNYYKDQIISSVILGGETGPRARPMNPDWVRSVRDQCAAAGVPFFFKSWGAYGLNWMNDDNGKIEGTEWMDKGIKEPGRFLDGRTHDELPWGKK